MERRIESKEKLPRQLIDIFIQSQAEAHEDRQCEDAIIAVQNEDCIVASAIDGASALSSVTTTEAKQGGLFAAQTIKHTLEQQFAGIGSAQGLITKANQELAELVQQQGVNPSETSALELSAASASVVRIDKHTGMIDFAQIGDTVALVEFNNGEVELVLPLDELEGRRQDLNDNDDLTRQLGGKYWDKERELATQVEQEIFTLLQQQGMVLDKPADVPQFILQQIRAGIAQCL